MNTPAISEELHAASMEEAARIPQSFEGRVKRTPEAIALVFDERELTFGELDEMTDGLGHRLQGLGVGPETLVGIFMDRSPGMIVALLAILKAGGAYVPIDPGYPGERIAWVIEDSRAQVVITTAELRHRLPATTATSLVLDDDDARVGGRVPGPVPCSATGTSLAYVIYTSGSTGKPKGVMVEHRNVLSFFAAMDGLLGTLPGTWLAVTSISFDISVLELLWTLTRGFKVVLLGDEGTQSIATKIIRHGVTHFQSTPTLARMLATDPRSLAALGSLKWLLLGGEALPAALLGTLRQATSCEIYNMYGPTETTIWSTAFHVPADPVGGATVPIGRPLANNRAYVLDPGLRRVADGEPGELYLGGEAVVRGYWDRPDLTGERFLPDPFGGGAAGCTAPATWRGCDPTGTSSSSGAPTSRSSCGDIGSSSVRSRRRSNGIRRYGKPWSSRGKIGPGTGVWSRISSHAMGRR